MVHVGAQTARSAECHPKNIHNYTYFLPPCPTTTPTTSADPLPAKSALFPQVQDALPAHMDREGDTTLEADDGGSRLSDIPRSVHWGSG